MDELRFDGRVAIITGGGRGLGRAYALLLASRGAKVVVNDLGVSMGGDDASTGPAEKVAQEIRAMGAEALANSDSVATPEGAAGIVAAAQEAFGRVDVMIHNAGNIRRGLLAQLSDADYEAVMAVHLRGGFHMVRACWPLMAAQQYGRFVLTASVNGLYGKASNGNYAMAKAGLIGLSHTAAIEGQALGIRSNVIVPAAVTRMSEGIDTSQFPPMEPAMVAPTVGWLAHEACSVSGEIYVAMGGRVARAYLAETPGVFRTDWSIEQVAHDIAAIRDIAEPVLFAPVPDGQLEHLLYGFAMAKQG